MSRRAPTSPPLWRLAASLGSSRQHSGWHVGDSFKGTACGGEADKAPALWFFSPPTTTQGHSSQCMLKWGAANDAPLFASSGGIQTKPFSCPAKPKLLVPLQNLRPAELEGTGGSPRQGFSQPGSGSTRGLGQHQAGPGARALKSSKVPATNPGRGTDLLGTQKDWELEPCLFCNMARAPGKKAGPFRRRRMCWKLPASCS